MTNNLICKNIYLKNAYRFSYLYMMKKDETSNNKDEGRPKNAGVQNHEKIDIKAWWNGLNEGWKTTIKNAANLESDPRSDNDFEMIMNLEYLELYFDYEQSQYITDLYPVRALKNLKDLNVSSILISDLSPLSTMANLETLELSNTQVYDLTPIQHLSTTLQIMIHFRNKD